jgi:hypothetical protein
MKTTHEISETIERELLSWPDVTVGQHRLGGRAFRVGRMEIGTFTAVASPTFPSRVAAEGLIGLIHVVRD